MLPLFYIYVARLDAVARIRAKFQGLRSRIFPQKMQEAVAERIMSCCLCQLGSVMIF